MTKFATYILPLILVLLLNVSCDTSLGKKKDQTGSSTIVGYVNAEPFYLISINTRIKDALVYQREENTILYQPTPSDILKLEYLSLRNIIRETGFSLPGNQINQNEILYMAKEIAIETGEDIVDRLKSGLSFQDVQEEYKGVSSSSEPVHILKGSNPGYDEAIWKAEPGEITGPIIHRDRVLIFTVIERGQDDLGNEWADIFQIDFLFPRDEARKQIEDKMMSKWSINIVDDFYSALRSYFEDNLVDAEKNLSKHLKSAESRNELSFYLMYLILLSKSKQNQSDLNLETVKKYLQDAIKNSSDVRIKPHYRYELGRILLEANEKDEAIEQFKMALEEVRTDIRLASKLVFEFEELGDEENLQKANEKMELLNDLLKSEQAKQPVNKKDPLESDISGDTSDNNQEPAPDNS